MIQWFRNMLFDETRFVRLVRAALIGLGAVATTPGVAEAIPFPYAGPGLMALGAFVGSMTGKPEVAENVK